ncbi:hypothetical protein ACFB49_33230 [Sphingomonas sp. DBB INV C78]
MPEIVTLHLAQAVAADVKGYRAGARHAMLIFIRGEPSDQDNARAREVAGKAGWIFVEIQRSKELGGDVELIEDDTLRDAAEHALQHGQCIVTYRDELPPDS